MRQLKDIQVFYAFHFDSSQRTSTKHEHGSYHVPWNSRNVEMTVLCPSVPCCSFFHQKPDLAFLARWWGHELPHRLENNPKLGIVFLFQSSELSGQIFVGSKHPA